MGSIISVKRSSPADCEIVWTKLSQSNGEILFGSFHHQPGSTVEIMEQLKLSVYSLRELAGIGGSHVILSGDFNLPDINWENGSIRSKPQHALMLSMKKMLEIVDDLNLTQVVREPTRQNDILDLLFTTHSDLVNGTFVVPGISDHNAVIYDIILKIPTPTNQPKSVYL